MPIPEYAVAVRSSAHEQFSVSIRTLLVMLVMAVWLPALAGFSLLARSTYLREVADVRRDVEQLGGALAATVERELDKRVMLATALSASPALAVNDFRTFHREATDALKGTGAWALLVDESRQLVNTIEPFKAQALRPRPIGLSLAREGASILFAARGAATGVPTLGAFVPDLSNASALRNVGVAFDPSAIQAIFDSQVYPQGSVAAVVNRDFVIVARSRDPQKWVGTKSGPEIQRRVRAGETGFGESVTLDGVPSLTYLTPPNKFGWSVVLALPKGTLMNSALRLSEEVLWASAAILAIGLGAALLFARRVGKLVVGLRSDAVQLGLDSVPPYRPSPVREVDEVSRALHLAGLRSHEAKLSLESRVRDAVEVSRTIQAQLLDAQKREAIGQLTGGFAHDFNNILQTIGIAIRMLERDAKESRHVRVLKAAREATGRASDLVRQMLSFGRSRPLQSEPVNLYPLLARNQELTGKAVGEGNALTVNVPDDLPAVLVDPAQLELAVLNLVFNARDAMPSGGHITISARMQDVAGVAGRREVCLSVSDEGTGMDDATKAKAFEPYFTTKAIGSGSGLGLAQVAAFVGQCAGRVTIESTLGVGTTVNLWLPVTYEPVTVRAIPAAPVPAIASMRILMVEDDALVSSVVTADLETRGHEVQLCASADSAHQILLEDARFDVLFTDVVMPGTLSGLDLALWTRTNLPQLPVVVATGYTRRDIPSDFEQMKKPYDIDALLVALLRAIQAGK